MERGNTMAERKNIAFFFGAGVEGKGNFDLPMGFEYLRKSLFTDKNGADLDQLKKSFPKEYFNKSYTLSKHTVLLNAPLLRTFILAKALNDPSYLSKHKEDICALLSQDELNELKEHYNYSGNELEKSGNSDSCILCEFKKILSGERKTYSQIINNILKDLFYETNNGEIGYDLNTSISDILDRYFHTIINPSKYGAIRFTKIFNYYWMCYFTVVIPIVEYLVQIPGNEELLKYCDDGKACGEKILKNLNEFTIALYKAKLSNNPDNPDEPNYYSLIRKKLSESKDALNCLGIATTNYFQFINLIPYGKKVYLNGQLKFFEFPEVLEVRDLAKEEILQEKIFFPFIFGQSLTKPIVNSKQIEAFFDFQKMLNQTDILIVFGFNLNEDDNHINAYLHDFTKIPGKRIIVVRGNNEQNNAYKKLHCKEDTIIDCPVEYADGKNKEIVDAIFEKIFSLV